MRFVCLFVFLGVIGIFFKVYLLNWGDLGDLGGICNFFYCSWGFGGFWMCVEGYLNFLTFQFFSIFFVGLQGFG